MRNTDPLDPMWSPEAVAPWAGRLLKLGASAARRVAPHLLRFVAGQRPELRWAWGAQEYRVQPDGVSRARREGDGYGDNPRRNYNEAVARREARQDVVDAAGELVLGAVEEVREAGAIAAQLLQGDGGGRAARGGALVDEELGHAERARALLDAADAAPNGDPDGLRSGAVGLRAALLALRALDDWQLAEDAAEELVQLQRAIGAVLGDRPPSGSEPDARSE